MEVVMQLKYTDFVHYLDLNAAKYTVEIDPKTFRHSIFYMNLEYRFDLVENDCYAILEGGNLMMGDLI